MTVLDGYEGRFWTEKLLINPALCETSSLWYSGLGWESYLKKLEREKNGDPDNTKRPYDVLSNFTIVMQEWTEPN